MIYPLHKKGLTMQKLLIGIMFAAVLTGCGTPTPNNNQTTQKKIDPSMSSKAVEKAINWKYCETKEY